jgi:hypothetical protein
MSEHVLSSRRSLRLEFTRVEIVDSMGAARTIVETSEETLALVERGKVRSVLFQCPCGCKDVLVINLDRKAGMAWRYRLRQGRLTLLPSVWRTSGCESHFVLWENRVWWCYPWLEDSSEPVEVPDELDREVRAEWRKIRAEQRKKDKLKS